MINNITTTDGLRIFKYAPENGRMMLYCHVGIEKIKKGEPKVFCKRISAAIGLNDPSSKTGQRN